MASPPNDHTSIELQASVAGQYFIERELGRGSMGVVYLARDISLDRPVAIKVMSNLRARSATARERFMREARTAAGFSHPNIVPIHAVEEREDLAFFVMGFISGETLRERVERIGPLTVSDTLRLLQDVAWALGYGHDRGIVHRDVKPDNIMIEDDTGRAVLMDFGIAQNTSLSAVTANGVLLGTPECISPEQSYGEEVDGRSDLYSLGVTCFYALTGRLPFESDTVQGMLAKHREETPPSVVLLRNDVPSKLALAIDRCLAKNREDRFHTADELAKAISAARSQFAEAPVAMRKVREKLETLTIDAAGWGSIFAIFFLDWVIFGDDPTLEWGVKIGVYFVGIGMITSGLAQVGLAVRDAISRGFHEDHLKNESLWTPPEDDGARGDGVVGRLNTFLEVAVHTGFLVALALAYMFGFWLSSGNPVTGGLRPWFFLAMASWNIALIVAPVLLGRSFARRAMRRWEATRRLWARLWQGRAGKWLFGVAKLGRRETDRTVPAPHATQTLVAGAAEDLFKVLPDEYKQHLTDLPDLINRLERAGSKLREREKGLERALAQVGSVASRVDRRLDRGRAPAGANVGPSVKARRDEVVEELISSRQLVSKQMAETLSVLETIRLGLIRLHTGVATVEDLDDELATGRRVWSEVEALLEGQKDIDILLERHDKQNQDD